MKLVLRVLLGLVLLLALAAGGAWIYLHPDIDRQDGIVSGQRNGKPLTLDILRPKRPNGLGIALMVSGGWRSSKAGQTKAIVVAPLLRAGYTVFAVCHVSRPESSIMDIITDMHRGVRFIRYHAKEYGVDPQRLGATGGSAGGHLSLMLATRGAPGDPAAADPVDRESSAVQAVAIFYPPTDLLNLGPSTENDGKGGPPISYRDGFGPEAGNPVAWQRIGHETSPIYYVTPAMPPVLIYHGDADTLVPLEQSLRFQARAKEVGLNVPVVVHAGGAHGWRTMLLDEFAFVDWFNRYLRDRQS
ncbi:MAG: alpha/beta hydrolase [Bryobacteraceae bacterium]|nr:alpha/beta hydrolase [Bryobacteraceae bacterium]